MIDEETFREDLYYRISEITLNLPPLRERPADIPVLAAYFAKRFAEADGVQAMEIAADGLERLQRHQWPGNVRELENIMHRAVLLARGPAIDADAIQVTSLATTPLSNTATQQDTASQDSQTLVGRTVAEVERDLILDTVSHCLGNRTHAANILGISIRTLRNKLKQYAQDGLPVPMKGEGERLSA